MVDRQALIGRLEAKDLPTFASAQQQLDAALEAEPASSARPDIDPEQLELRQALGVA